MIQIFSNSLGNEELEAVRKRHVEEDRIMMEDVERMIKQMMSTIGEGKGCRLYLGDSEEF